MKVKSLTRKNEAGWFEDLPLTSGVSAARATTMEPFWPKARRSRPRQARREVGTEGSGQFDRARPREPRWGSGPDLAARAGLLARPADASALLVATMADGTVAIVNRCSTNKNERLTSVRSRRFSWRLIEMPPNMRFRFWGIRTLKTGCQSIDASRCQCDGGFDLSQQQGLESPARQRFPPFLVSSPRWGLHATIKGRGGESDEGEKQDLITSHFQMVPGPPRFFHRPTWRT